MIRQNATSRSTYSHVRVSSARTNASSSQFVPSSQNASAKIRNSRSRVLRQKRMKKSPTTAQAITSAPSRKRFTRALKSGGIACPSPEALLGLPDQPVQQQRHAD